MPTFNSVADQSRSLLRAAVDGAYDLQHNRMQMGNRLGAAFRRRDAIAVPPVAVPDLESDFESDETEEDASILAILKSDYRSLMEGKKVAPNERTFRPVGLITTMQEFYLVEHWMQLLKMEEQAFRRLTPVLVKHPIYVKFLEEVTGCGPAMSAVMLSYFDPHKARHISNFWKYAGLDVANDGRARSMRKEHLVERTYTNRKGELTTAMGITFNPFLRTKLLGVLADSFIRSGSPWRKVYDDYKHRLQTDPTRTKATSEEYKALYKTDPEAANQLWTPQRINRAAKRYMVKMFLVPFWVKWRKLENLPVTGTYHEDKLGHAHAA